MIVTDAAVLSQKVNGAIMVVDADKTPKQHLKQAVSHLTEVNSPILGVVLNRISPKGDGYYYQYYRQSYYFDQSNGNGKVEHGANRSGPLKKLRRQRSEKPQKKKT